MKKMDPNHNEFFDSGSMLEEGYRKAMGKSGIEVPKDTGGRHSMTPQGSPGEDSFFMSQDPRKVGIEVAAGSSSNDDVPISHMAKVVMEIKDNAVALFEKVASDSSAPDVERLIRSIEHLEKTCGLEVDQFEPLRHMSGLKIREPLENANRVVDNTVYNYDIHLISSIESRMSGSRPSVAIAVVGQHKGHGFVAQSLVTAKRDFTGSEAVDYVHASPQGLFSVKRFERDRWVDASSEFDIKHRVSEVKLEQHDIMQHTAFLGEKIASSGKEMITKALNLTEEDVVFGKYQVFASDSEKVDNVLKFVRGQISG